uniref:TNFR-Cys domain-containing protein n=1 Tax=Salarias fasciatus TaxID=181472 RepID=A0A672HDZ6_SALFA
MSNFPLNFTLNIGFWSCLLESTGNSLVGHKTVFCCSYDCLKCPAGFYCPEGRSDPMPCPPGSFNPLEGQDELADCRECYAGKACTQSESECQPCPPGWYCLAGSGAPSGRCSSGHYCPQGKHKFDISGQIESSQMKRILFIFCTAALKTSDRATFIFFQSEDKFSCEMYFIKSDLFSPTEL